MTAALVIVSIIAAAASATAIAIAVRHGELQKQLAEQVAARAQLEALAQDVGREAARRSQASREQLEEVRQDAASLRADLEGCRTPGAQTARINRLLAKAAKRGTGTVDPVAPAPAEPESL